MVMSTLLFRARPMSSPSSITDWIRFLKTADHSAAANKVYRRYFLRLVRLARLKLQGAPRRAADEEDVALSALDSFLRAAAQDRFPKLNDRDDLWQLLVLITERKAKDLAQHERRLKRGGGGVLDEAALAADHADGPLDLARVPGPEPTPAFAAEMADQCRQLLNALPAELRQVALWKMEGFANDDIADRLHCALRSVERKLAVIRGVWKKGGLS